METFVKPFTIAAPQEQLDDLTHRLQNTRWPKSETVRDWSQGVPLDVLRPFCDHWAAGYRWRETESRLNRLPQFTTEIDGVPIHFVHVRSANPEATPLLLTHGWPGSFLEFERSLAPLTDPLRHGGEADDAFHVICPSLPGYAFSGQPCDTGWNIERIAEAWAELMSRLGYSNFGAAGSDWGTSITTMLALAHPDRLAGIHLIPPLVAPDPATSDQLTAFEMKAIHDLDERRNSDSGYSEMHRSRPQTIGYALTDSPAALCAWILEKIWSWADHSGDVFEVLSRDQILDNVMIYWLTATAASSARLYWESIDQVGNWFSAGTADIISVPTACTVFPREVPRPSRRWAERRFPDIRYWGQPARGGHFGAWEQPSLFVDEVRAAFRAIRGAS